MTNNNIDFRFLAVEVIKRLDILEVAENEGLRLRKTGRNYFALCPFHSERTPSFSISPKKQMFNCFSCGKGGNVITLLAALRGVNNGKIIYQYANAFGLINRTQMSSKQKQELKKRTIKYEFKRKEESHFEVVHRFLCDQVHAFKRAMKQVRNVEEVKALQDFYQIYDKLPYYQYLLECLLGDYGEVPQVEAYLKGEEVMNEWNYRINN
jgi:DNA primase